MKKATLAARPHKSQLFFQSEIECRILAFLSIMRSHHVLHFIHFYLSFFFFHPPPLVLSTCSVFPNSGKNDLTYLYSKIISFKTRLWIGLRVETGGETCSSVLCMPLWTNLTTVRKEGNSFLLFLLFAHSSQVSQAIIQARMKVERNKRFAKFTRCLLQQFLHDWIMAVGCTDLLQEHYHQQSKKMFTKAFPK